MPEQTENLKQEIQKLKRQVDELQQANKELFSRTEYLLNYVTNLSSLGNRMADAIKIIISTIKFDQETTDNIRKQLNSFTNIKFN